VVNDSETFTYSYVPNSDLVSTMTGPHHKAVRTWEPHRDVLQSIANQNLAGTTTISQYGYTVNNLGQRTHLHRSGTAFSAAHHDEVGYNAAGEVTSTTRKTGTTAGAGTAIAGFNCVIAKSDN
jgi:hypothetical protein